jgi:hypothetical protein
MRTTSIMVASLALAAGIVSAQAQQGPGSGMAPGTYSASKIGQSAESASQKLIPRAQR